MKNVRSLLCFIISAFFLVGASASVFAGEGRNSYYAPRTDQLSPSFYNFFVPMNAARKISFKMVVNIDCTSAGSVVARIITPPTHGTISVKNGKDRPNFIEPNPRVSCNSKELPSTQVWYTPEKDYLGSDTVSISYILPTGSTHDVNVSIIVK